MNFRLFYRGPLKPDAKATIEEKHKIREKFHEQLAELWKQNPLKQNYAGSTIESKYPDDIIKIDEYQFMPLISQSFALVAKLNILFLRQQEPGKLIGHGGDIDNRIKTLFDALRVPKQSELRKIKSMSNTNIFFCLLEDDALITEFSITTDRLLQNGDPADVVLIIEVETKATKRTWKNAFL